MELQQRPAIKVIIDEEKQGMKKNKKTKQIEQDAVGPSHSETLALKKILGVFSVASILVFLYLMYIFEGELSTLSSDWLNKNMDT